MIYSLIFEQYFKWNLKIVFLGSYWTVLEFKGGEGSFVQIISLFIDNFINYQDNLQSQEQTITLKSHIHHRQWVEQQQLEEYRLITELKEILVTKINFKSSTEGNLLSQLLNVLTHRQQSYQNAFINKQGQQ